MSAEPPALDLDDKFHDECGLYGVWNHAEAANVAYLGLYALQHRGQESAGIASTDGHHFQVEKAMGWVADVFSRERLKRLPGHRAIGHVRYSTAGSSNLRNAQPITGTTAHGPAAIADQLARALTRVRGAYTLLLLAPDSMIGVRDPSGFRPLTLGSLGDAWVLASETCALDLMEAKVERDVEPGEILIVDERGLTSVKPFRPAERLQCVFEYVYFARPDSVLWGRNVHTVRKALGHQLEIGRAH